MKIITICGSLKYKDEMIRSAIRLQLEGNVVLMPIFPVEEDKTQFTKEEILILGNRHRERIKMADAIFVVNVDHYIGESTKNEIAFAKSLNKEIIYLI